MVIHVVEPGESIYSIARSYNVSPRSIIVNNGLTDPDRLLPGQALLIIVPRTVHVVGPEDTLSSIARQYNTTTLALMQNNPFLGGQSIIYAGQELIIDNYSRRLDEARIDAYLYPGTDISLLRRVMPYLTYGTVFTYNFTEDGELLPLDSGDIVNTGSSYFVTVGMSLSTEGQETAGALVNSILGNNDAQNRLVENIVQIMQQEGYTTLDVDFTDLLPENRENYVEFIDKLVLRLNPLGYPVVVLLPPKTSGEDEQYAAYDYAELGRVANAATIKAYDLSDRFGPPSPVVPLERAREVLDYAVSVIPPEKLFIGLPDYGYEWTLPFVPGESEAQIITNAEALRLAEETRADIFFDEEAQAPFFYHADARGTRHQVWFEDARSIEALARLLDEYNLRGINLWPVTDYYQPLWTVLNNLYDITKLSI